MSTDNRKLATLWVASPDADGTGWEPPQFAGSYPASEAHTVVRALRGVWHGHLVWVRPVGSPPVEPRP